ncbi:aldo/keto reductase [Pontibacter sp. 172403-2]|uniref:aldo/keto reductase n=1 Tax=Pontibacter rufus TaxID=2791028 RepID=UPI0018AF586D|nr:aldo/keto reductase [Pontibacter sp. 172403-2]MBF9253776.1 aldo/keto reductase [Pontibacter sp. 172403-2]
MSAAKSNIASGFATNRVVLGTVQFGLDYGISNTAGKVPLEEVCRILAYAHAKGVTMLDTAAAYGDSETVLGKSLQETGLSFQIISKLPPTVTARDVRRTVEASLEKLGADKLYGYLFHSFNSYKEHPAVLEQLCLLQEEGLIAQVGFSLYHPAEALELLDKNITFGLTQFPYNIFDRRFDLVLDKLQAAGIETHVRSVFLQGLFFIEAAQLPPYFSKVAGKIAALQQLAQKANIPLEALLMHFVLQVPGINNLVIGVNSLKALKANLATSEYQAAIQYLLPELKRYEVTDEDILLPYKWKTS